MFRISEIEWKNMSSQFVTTSRVKRPKAALPYAFTEQGVAMLSAVLRSGMAIQVSISIMKAFVAMRNYITTATTVTSELAEIRAKLALLERADEDNAEAVNDLSEDMRRELDNIYEAIAALSVKVPEARKKPRPIGFKLPKDLRNPRPARDARLRPCGTLPSGNARFETGRAPKYRTIPGRFHAPPIGR